jgi:hypothetical protein
VIKSVTLGGGPDLTVGSGCLYRYAERLSAGEVDFRFNRGSGESKGIGAMHD